MRKGFWRTQALIKPSYQNQNRNFLDADWIGRSDNIAFSEHPIRERSDKYNAISRQSAMCEMHFSCECPFHIMSAGRGKSIYFVHWNTLGTLHGMSFLCNKALANPVKKP